MTLLRLALGTAFVFAAVSCSRDVESRDQSSDVDNTAVNQTVRTPQVDSLPTDCHGGGDEGAFNYAFGQMYRLSIDDTLLANSTWDRRNPTPPVTANEAMVLADRARLRFIKDKKLQENDCWTLTGAEVRPFDNDDKWYWRVRFEAFISQTGPPHEIEFFVLMDGVVVEPTLHDDNRIDMSDQGEREAQGGL